LKQKKQRTKLLKTKRQNRKKTG